MKKRALLILTLCVIMMSACAKNNNSVSTDQININQENTQEPMPSLIAEKQELSSESPVVSDVAMPLDTMQPSDVPKPSELSITSQPSDETVPANTDIKSLVMTPNNPNEFNFDIYTDENNKKKTIVLDEIDGNNILKIIDKGGSIQSFNMSENGLYVSGYGDSQASFTIGLSKDEKGDYYVHVEIYNVIDRWTSDENKAFSGVLVAYILLDGSDFNIIDKAEYVHGIDRSGNSWDQQLILNGKEVNSIEILQEEYTDIDGTNYDILNNIFVQND